MDEEQEALALQRADELERLAEAKGTDDQTRAALLNEGRRIGDRAHKNSGTKR